VLFMPWAFAVPDIDKPTAPKPCRGYPLSRINNDSNYAPAAAILLGNGDGTFQTPSRYSVGSGQAPYSLAVGDLNENGKPDIVAGVEAAVSFLLNAEEGV
jgi:hypothetical protein